MSRSSDSPDDLDEVVAQLLAHRDELTPLELDRIKRQSRARAIGRPGTQGKREEHSVMRTRRSIVAMLATGALLSSGGVAMGVSGLGASHSASSAQYNVQTPSNTGQQQGAGGGGGTEVLGAHQTHKPSTSGSAPATATAPAAVARPGSQQALQNSGSSLPFTGYAAIPVLLIGLALLGSGVMMRRRTTARDRT
jgi:hypothetical protein